AFPYAFIPWISAALLRPLLGDWVVTLWLVVGTIGLIAATFWAFPELRRGWWAAAVLVNPALVVASIIGQLPFLWGASMLVGAEARGRGGVLAASPLRAGCGARRPRSGDASRRRPPHGVAARRVLVAMGAGPSAPLALLRPVAHPRPPGRVARGRLAGVRRQLPGDHRHRVRGDGRGPEPRPGRADRVGGGASTVPVDRRTVAGARARRVRRLRRAAVVEHRADGAARVDVLVGWAQPEARYPAPVVHQVEQVRTGRDISHSSRPRRQDRDVPARGAPRAARFRVLPREHRPEQLGRCRGVFAVPEEPTGGLRHHLRELRPRVAHERACPAARAEDLERGEVRREPRRRTPGPRPKALRRLPRPPRLLSERPAGLPGSTPPASGPEPRPRAAVDASS